MEKLKRSIIITLIIAIFAACGFVAGIPFIIMGAKNSTFLLVLGIVLVAFGFYGTPLLFISYANKKRIKRVCLAITKDKLTDIPTIAKHLQLPEETIRQDITIAINADYIDNYIFNGETLTKSINKYSKKMRCENCGGVLVEKDGKVYCPYCGTYYSKEN